MNAYYGLQVGEGANNKNENYGASAWFFWTGEYVLDGASQGTMASSGDIFIDLDCCLGWQIDYDYTIVDDCGNSNGFSYTDLGTGDFGNSANSTVSGGHTPVDITAGTSSLKDPIRITGLQPNPTSDISTLGFVVTNNMRLRIDLYTMSGGYVAELFDGNASEDVQYMLDIDATSCPAVCTRSACRATTTCSSRSSSSASDLRTSEILNRKAVPKGRPSAFGGQGGGPDGCHPSG